MPKRLAWPWIAAALALPIALGLVLFLISQEFSRADQISSQVEESYRASGEIGELLALHQDVELGQRGYILTGDPEFLAPYASARPQLAAMFLEVRQLIGDSNALRGLEETSQDKLAFVDETIDLTRSGRIESARTMISGGEGNRLMDRIRTRIAEMQRVEAQRLDERNATARDARRKVQLIVLAIAVVLTLSLITSMLAIARALQSRARVIGRFRDLSARQHAIFDGARDGIVTINPSGSIESFNTAITTMTGYSEAEILRRDIGVLFEVAPDKGKKETFLKRLARRSLDSAENPFELLARRKDGSYFPIDVIVSPVELDSGKIFVAIVRDAAERKRVEEMKSEFVSTVSHELRTPLTSIAGSLGLVAGGMAGELPDKAARLVHIARSNCDRLVRLINDILDMEKLETGKVEFQLRSIELASFLQQAIDANAGFADEYSVSLALEKVPKGATVIADSDPLMQVVTNLLSNAVKFSEAAGMVSVRVLPLDRRWRIEVQDRGQGIPDEFRDRIFGKFAQAESSDNRAKGGTGLGLSIVKEIVIRMGGEVSFQTQPGEGTTFHVDLPAQRAAPPSHAPRNLGILSVLHVEDDPDVLEIVSNALKDRFTLHAAQTLEEARQHLARLSYDIVILDFALPDGSGEQLIPLLRECGTQILVFTAQDADPDVAEKVDALLVKSRSSLDGLVETLDRLIERNYSELLETEA